MPDGPTIISGYQPGIHSADLGKSISRLDDEASWVDLSCVIVTPAGGSVPTRVVSSWMSMIKPPNNRSVHIFAQGCEVGEAYTHIVEAILANPELSTWKYLLCIEHDNAPPADGMVKLLRRMEKHPEYAGIGGLYWTKGISGVSQVWGDPRDPSWNARPQKPDPNGGLVECNGLGMGFTMFRISMFKDTRLRRPWFKTPASIYEGASTQDLWFASDARKHGYRFCVDCDVRVGHWEESTQTMW